MDTCRMCKSEIAEGAKKCIHCDSYQNYRRFFAISTTTVSLLIALISVATLFASSIDEFTTRPGNAEAVVGQADRQYLAILASNSGETAVAAREGVLFAPTTDGRFLGVYYAPDLSEDASAGLLKTEAFTGLRFRFTEARIVENPPVETTPFWFENWMFMFRYTTFEGNFRYLVRSRAIKRDDGYFPVLQWYANDLGVTLKGI